MRQSRYGGPTVCPNCPSANCCFQLGKLKFATVSEFKGRKMVNIREFYMTAEAELRPGKKGVWGEGRCNVGRDVVM